MKKNGRLVVPPREGLEIPVVLSSEKRKSTECKKYRKFNVPKVSTVKLRRQQTVQTRWRAESSDASVKSKLVIEKV